MEYMTFAQFLRGCFLMDEEARIPAEEIFIEAKRRLRKMEQEKLLEWIRRSRQGDPDAQEALILAAQQRVYYHCKKMLKDEEDARDATQDVLITMLTSLDKLREPAAFWGWVNGITANRCRHLLSAPHKEWQIPENEEGTSMLDSLEDPDEQIVPDKALDNEETRRMILDLVDGLPPEQRMSVLFYYYDEMSVKQIAEAMGTSEGTVKSRLNYARKAIRNGVEEHERRGVKLYGVSPLLLLAYFLRTDAAAAALSDSAAAAITEAAVEAAGAASAAGTSTAAGGAAAAAGAKTAGALSTKVIAAILAGAVAIGGIAAGIGAARHRNAPGAGTEQAAPMEENGGETDRDAEGPASTDAAAPSHSAERFPERAVVNAGAFQSSLMDADGNLWVWGLNEGLSDSGYVPEKLMDHVRDADFDYAFLVLKSDGTLLDMGTTITPVDNAPVEKQRSFSYGTAMEILEDTAAVRCGTTFAAAIKNDGTLWTWGNNDCGQLGDGTAEGSYIPIPILEDVTAVSCGQTHGAAIKEDGTLWMWGSNSNGQLGNGTTEDAREPVQVLEHVAAVSCGLNFTAAIRTDGSLWTWGSNTHGGLGNGTTEDSLTPVKILNQVVSVSCGDGHAAAIQKDGSLWIWGYDGDNQLSEAAGAQFYSNLQTTCQPTPTRILEDVADVSCGMRHTLILKTDGTVWSWGYNDNGELGNGDRARSAVPVQAQVTAESLGTLPWEGRTFEALDDPTSAGGEADRYPEAYAAYLDVLNEHKSLIDAYAEWGTCGQNVVLADIMGDGTPELIFVEAEPPYFSESDLNILTYQDGQVITLARESWDFFAGSGLKFNLYQAAGSKELRAYSKYGDTYTVEEWIRFADAGTALSPERVQYDSRDGGSYTRNGAAIDKAEYDRIQETIPGEAEQLVMSSIYDNTSAMSCDDAIAFLQNPS